MVRGGRGFTLVETLVAVSILLTVIIGPMTIASRGMQSAYLAGDQTTAVYLAQEAIEHIQQLRDDVALENFQDYQNDGNDGDGDTSDWYDNLPSECKDSDGCDYDFEDGDYNDCTNTESSNVCRIEKNIDAPNGRIYGYGSGADWEETRFTRIIRVGTPTDLGGNGWDTSTIGGVPVTVTVSWDAGANFGGVRTVTLQTYLYDHYTRYE